MANVPIPAGTVIWIMEPSFDVVMTPRAWDALSPFAREQVRKHVYLDVETRQYVLCSDDAKYMNHSETPNTTNVADRTVTNRDIRAGEELTTDYREFDLESRETAARRGGRVY